MGVLGRWGVTVAELTTRLRLLALDNRVPVDVWELVRQAIGRLEQLDTERNMR